VTQSCIIYKSYADYLKAKKLKQTWVENKKIKSKWKAQKLKEGLSTTPKAEQSRVGAEEESYAEQSQSGSESEQGDEKDQEDEMSEPEEKPAPKKSTLHPSRAHIHPEFAPRNSSKRRRVDEAEAGPAEPQSLRELTRQAYSRSSLHTFKANPGRGSGTRGRGRGGARGRGGQRGETGRGQPNMKLRMDAMLEKIKQTLA